MAATNADCNEAAAQDERPFLDEKGRTAHYEPTTKNDGDNRGVLLFAAEGNPTVQWHMLERSFVIARPFPNGASYFIHDKLNPSKRKEAQKSLEKAFALAFPHKDPAIVSVWAGTFNNCFKFRTDCSGTGCKGCYISFETPSSNVPVSQIVAMAFVHSWKADGVILGIPWHMGLKGNRSLQGVQFAGIPDDRKEDFAASVPKYVRESFSPLTDGIQLVDLWENQKKEASSWKFTGTMTALVSMKGSASVDALREEVKKWPGWYHWDNDHLIKVTYPGRFKFCEKCKHTAQDVDGPFKRHTEDICISIICGDCGHRGHDSTSKPQVEAHKKICEEGKAKRREERLSQKTDDLAHLDESTSSVEAPGASSETTEGTVSDDFEKVSEIGE